MYSAFWVKCLCLDYFNINYPSFVIWMINCNYQHCVFMVPWIWTYGSVLFRV